MKLTVYVKEIDITRQTDNRWFHEGRILWAYQIDTDTIIVPNDIFLILIRKSKNKQNRKEKNYAFIKYYETTH